MLTHNLQFERGTIAYMISSTLTRPTTISPISHADRKVSFVENIDIAPIIQPRPRIISLEPVSRRIRARSRARKRPNAQEGSSADGDARTTDFAPTQRTSHLTEESEMPGSPAPSDISFDSGVSSAGALSGVEMSQMSASTSSSGTVGGSASRVIHATVALDRAGFLRGDTIHIKISVNHMKRVKSRHGVIVTLYRQARVDMHPIVPVANEQLSEDYYPRSKTGLGGLSLTEAGSHHLFRKDLSQSFASLIINPHTLTAEVKAAVRVPEEAFPTISGVPGQMISFKYYVEVIVDLQGKLAMLDRYVPTVGGSAPTPFGTHPVMGRGEDANGNVFSTVGANFVDTKEIRRDKSVVTCVFEVIVGTRDSERTRRRELARAESHQQSALDMDGSVSHIMDGQHQHDPNHDWHGYGEVYDGSYYDPSHGQYDQHDWDPSMEEYPTEQNIPLPLPEIAQAEEGLSEKERLKIHEERLLPSRPPEEGESSADAARHAPSAPILPYNGIDAYIGPSAPHLNHHVPVGPSAPPLDDLHADVNGEASVPSYDAHPLPAGVPAPTDDKQELLQRRLENDRSAPDMTPDSDGAGPSAATPRPDYAPSAPILDDHEESALNIGRVQPDSSLPRYER